MKEKNYMEEKLNESAELMVDVIDTYKVRLGDLCSLFKFAFGQSPKQFKDILDYTFFVKGIPKENSPGKLETIIEKFITAVRYFSYLGMDEEKINRQLSNFGITINKTDWSPEGGDKANGTKYRKLWEELYPNDEALPVNADLLNMILNEGVNIKMEILALTDDVSAISENVEDRCEITKSSFKKGVGLKTKVLRGKDITETINKIEKTADDTSAVIELMG